MAIDFAKLYQHPELQRAAAAYSPAFLDRDLRYQMTMQVRSYVTAAVQNADTWYTTQAAMAGTARFRAPAAGAAGECVVAVVRVDLATTGVAS